MQVDNPLPGAVNSAVDVEKRLYAIARLKEDITLLEEDKKAHNEFYRAEVEKKNRAIEFLETGILAWFNSTGRKNCKTVLGTAFRVRRRKIKYALSDESLLEWAIANAPECVVTKTTTIHRVDKKELDAIALDGRGPEGTQFLEKESIAIRQPGLQDEPSEGFDFSDYKADFP